MKEVENLANKLLKLSEEKAELEIKNEALEIENINLKSVTAECLSTSELVDILKEREGVTSIQVEIDSRVKLDEEGPVTILRVIDQEETWIKKFVNIVEKR